MTNQSLQETSGETVAKEQTDEIQLTEYLSEQLAQLYLSDNHSDLAFIVEDQRLPAHSLILVARSEYFCALLYSDLGYQSEKQTEVQLQVPLKAFKALLKYIYSGRMALSTMDDIDILHTLGLATEYGLAELKLPITEYLGQHLSLTNVCKTLDAARLHNMKDLVRLCLTFMDRNTADILQHETFRDLSKESLEEVLKRDTFFAPEEQIFTAVKDWCKLHSNIDVASVISCIRLPLMQLDDLLQATIQSGLLDPMKVIHAIVEQRALKSLPYRGALRPEQNVATKIFGASTIRGTNPNTLLDGDVKTSDFTEHPIKEGNGESITVELGHNCIINHIKMLLWDADNRTYSYFVEVSANQTHWDRVVDYTKHHCRSWQYLYFPPRPVRYIKVVGTHNSANANMHLVSLEARYTASMPKMVDGFVAPTSNIATTALGAIVVQGDRPSALLNGDYINYDGGEGYTWHIVGTGAILVRLGQPYYIGSMRLLLWDKDDRTYNFYIETSTNQTSWETIVDKRSEPAKSWQNLSFPPRPMAFIRIVGTKNSVNNAFHCIHLECPSQDHSLL